MTAPTGARLPELVRIMRRLLAPDGCPWDREQTLETLRPYVVEEAHEVVDAIDRGALDELRDELGDLLLQIVFQAELSEGRFDVDDVIGGICDKMVRRHPHVFGDAKAKTSAEVKVSWEAIKAKEKAGRGVLDGVPVTMPALLRAMRMGEKAAHLGLDWGDAAGARAKVDEELSELDAALVAGDEPSVEGEIGDALFSLVNLARKRSVDPEAALRGSLERFSNRVRFVEERLGQRAPQDPSATEAELDGWWNEAKAAAQE
jgi:MazG family protein